MKVNKTVDGLPRGVRVSVSVELPGGGDRAAVRRASAAARQPPPEPLSESPTLAPLAEGLPSLREVERRYVAQVVAEAGGNMTRAAEVLQVDRRTLYRMCERFGLAARGRAADAGSGAG